MRINGNHDGRIVASCFVLLIALYYVLFRLLGS